MHILRQIHIGNIDPDTVPVCMLLHNFSTYPSIPIQSIIQSDIIVEARVSKSNLI